jgi:hypothetical protein
MPAAESFPHAFKPFQDLDSKHWLALVLSSAPSSSSTPVCFPWLFRSTNSCRRRRRLGHCFLVSHTQPIVYDGRCGAPLGCQVPEVVGGVGAFIQCASALGLACNCSPRRHCGITAALFTLLPTLFVDAGRGMRALQHTSPSIMRRQSRHGHARARPACSLLCSRGSSLTPRRCDDSSGTCRA